MGIPEANCSKCLKTCKDGKDEMDLGKEDYLKTKTENHKINNEAKKLKTFQQGKGGVSINSILGKTEIATNSKDNNFTKKEDDNKLKTNILLNVNGKKEEIKEIKEKSENDSNNISKSNNKSESNNSSSESNSNSKEN